MYADSEARLLHSRFYRFQIHGTINQFSIDTKYILLYINAMARIRGVRLDLVNNVRGHQKYVIVYLVVSQQFDVTTSRI